MKFIKNKGLEIGIDLSEQSIIKFFKYMDILKEFMLESIFQVMTVAFQT